ncbi:DNA-3-methyladenine glycosylase I [Marinimicrobium alkaliphilum]|uniref:DNA-3-methyladenine glycosylase I n=1 Tax=Marinimicrobium alkaliphilum TaxID=2202654 RepID=UPI000DBA237E|nr:DNA-3-methyladenine glycosylase I [Marinimicrobium alkaliphilum]
MASAQALVRCDWCGDDPLYQAYHDDEWGVPLRDERKLFEFLILEGAQAGLAWITVLRKRAHYREVFDQFDPEQVARYCPARIETLLQDPGIIRNRLKVESAVRNARAWLALKDAGIDPVAWLWQWVEGDPQQNHWRKMSDVPVTTPASDAMSKMLKQRGFNFVGSTICYAFMQATGMVNDHLVTCHRHQACAAMA